MVMWRAGLFLVAGDVIGWEGDMVMWLLTGTPREISTLHSCTQGQVLATSTVVWDVHGWEGEVV